MVAGSLAKLDAPPRKKRFRTSASAHARAVDECEAMMDAGDWREARGCHLVVLCEMLHERCYGVAPSASEASPEGRARAASMAARMVERDFGGAPARAVAYVRWAWQREIEREAWRRQNGRTEGKRLDWYGLFVAGKVLTDYRLHVARAGEKF